MVVCESQSVKSVESVCDRCDSRMSNRLEAICNSQNQLIVESDMVNITAESVSRIANLSIKSERAKRKKSVSQIDQTCECGRIKFFKSVCNRRDSRMARL